MDKLSKRDFERLGCSDVPGPQLRARVFLLEGLGGKISVTRDLLNTANLNWAYSELFQNYDRR